MSWQPIEEKEAERQLIREFSGRINVETDRLQSDEDDGGVDGLIRLKNGKKIAVEARRKGFPNHGGRACRFNDGWKTWFLVKDGIYLNESTIRGHKDSGFVYLVEIKGDGVRAANVHKSRINELLAQPYQTEKSTNSGNRQSVKGVPVNWFEEK